MLRKLFPVNPLSLFQADQIGKLANMSMKDMHNAAGAYFRGAGPMGDNVATGKLRQRVAIGAGSLMAANAVGVNPMGLTDKANNLAMLGVHMGLGYSAFKLGGAGKLLGLGYMALTAGNTFRGGDNVGPM